MRIHELIAEIKENSRPSRKTAAEVFRLLDNNKPLFSASMDADYLQSISTQFEEFSNSHFSSYDNPSFVRDFEQQYQSLLYNLDKII